LTLLGSRLVTYLKGRIITRSNHLARRVQKLSFVAPDVTHNTPHPLHGAQSNTKLLTFADMCNFDVQTATLAEIGKGEEGFLSSNVLA
jgi:hypothetical protein